MENARGLGECNWIAKVEVEPEGWPSTGFANGYKGRGDRSGICSLLKVLVLFFLLSIVLGLTCVDVGTRQSTLVGKITVTVPLDLVPSALRKL